MPTVRMTTDQSGGPAQRDGKPGGLRRILRAWTVAGRRRLSRGWRLPAERRLAGDAGAATAEYAVATMAAVGFAGLLIIILRGDEVRGILTDLVRNALSVG